ncbi:MAG: phosphatidate cytidylyltransferase, partial [Gammaproteobacteria bacterium]|nr:phosphatidate cytidylyltransferase [Gammaproteobacteria bacterium]
MSKLLQRIITAAILLVVLLVVFFRLPQSAAIGLLGAFVVLAAWEWSAFLFLKGFVSRALFTVFIVALMVGALLAFPQRLPLLPVLTVALLWWCSAFIWVLRYPTSVRRDVTALCGVLLLLPAWVSMLALFSLPGQQGAQFVLFALSIVWAADIGAYFVGRRLGRTKLAPKVSPGKTWEGLGGGLIAATGVALFGSWWFGLSPLFMVPAVISVAIISVIGDLTVSMFKRNAGLKDSGHLFPGHGGVLDRIDSATAALPLFALALFWRGL